MPRVGFIVLPGFQMMSMASLSVFEHEFGTWTITPHVLSGRVGPRRLQGRGPPEQIVDHRSGRGRELGQPGIDIGALVVSPQGGDRDVDR
jgi:hypothetical protein